MFVGGPRKAAVRRRRELRDYWELSGEPPCNRKLSMSTFQRAAARYQSRSRSLYLNENVRDKYT